MDARGNSLMPVCHARAPLSSWHRRSNKPCLVGPLTAGSRAGGLIVALMTLSSLVGATMHTGCYQPFCVAVGTTTGIDIGKNPFHVAGLDQGGGVACSADGHAPPSSKLG